MNIHSINYLFLISVISLWMLVSCTAHKSSEQSMDNEELIVATYSASEEGFKSNSHLIEFKENVILIDAQFISDDANKVVNLIRQSGKNLIAIFVTHPHPDHYYGLEIIGKEFPNTLIYGGAETIKQVENSSQYWNGENAEAWKPERFITLESDIMVVSGLEIQYKIFKNSESKENTVLYIPSKKILFIGDLSSNNVHMWLTEGETENWLVNLEQVKKMGTIDKIYPGHGPVSDQQIIDNSKNYINDVTMIIRSSHSTDEAIRKINEKYPQYEMPRIMEGTVYGLFETNK